MYNILKMFISLVQFSRSVMSDCDPMDCSMAGFPVHHQLLEAAQTHVHWAGYAKNKIFLYWERKALIELNKIISNYLFQKHNDNFKVTN